MIEFTSVTAVAFRAETANGVSTWAMTSLRDQPCVRMKSSIAFSRSIRSMISLRMCSCGKPRVCPVSCRTTRWNSESGVFMVKLSRFIVGSSSAMESTSVPRYDQ